MKEEWKPIEGYEGLYEVSNKGRIRSLPREVMRSNGSLLPIKGRVLKATKNGDGYRFVKLYKNKKAKNLRVHRIIANAFISNPENKKYINHKNGIKSDNRIENLEWCTFSENIQHAHSNGLHQGTRGESIGISKLTKEDVIEIRKRAENGEYKRSISKDYPVSESTIGRVVNKETWVHI